MDFTVIAAPESCHCTVSLHVGRGRLARGSKDSMAISDARKAEIIKEFATHEGDTGSPEVQIAVLTENIRDLTEHLKIHRHDFSSRRGLLAMVSKRNRLSGYLKKTDRDRYLVLIQKLGLRCR